MSNNIFQFIREKEIVGGVSSSTIENLLERRFIHNLKGQNVTKMIMNSRDCISKFAIGENDEAVTIDLNNEVKLWDVSTGKCKWTFTVNPPILWCGLIQIIDGNLVCSGVAENSGQDAHLIGIFNLQLHKKIAIFSGNGSNFTGYGRRLQNNLQDGVFIHNKKIFCVKNTADLCEIQHDEVYGWNLDGKKLQVITQDDYQFYFDNPFNDVIKLQNSRIVFKKNSIWIQETNNENKIHKVEMQGNVEAFCLDSSHLRLAFINQFEKNKIIESNLTILDLNENKIIQEYNISSMLKSSRHKNSISSKSDWINKIIMQNEWVYLGSSQGKVVAVNLDGKKQTELGIHTCIIDHFSLIKNILVSVSQFEEIVETEIKFWDTRTLTLIKSIKLNSLTMPQFMDGKMYAFIEKGLICWNYMNGNQGEKLAEGSAKKIDSDKLLHGI